ncbi:MAG: hypothetical protein JWO36_4622 [Myxococcales bacterium]|nr:hypothetical protein [Myxococcales bacterium]
MELATFRYAKGAWSEAFPALDSANTMIIAFAAPSYHDRPELLAELARAYPQSAVIGCSTSGEIDHTRVRDESIMVAAVRFGATRVRHAATRLGSVEDSYAAGVKIADQLRAPDLRAVLVLSEGLHVNGSELVRGLNSELPEEVVVTGGLAGDGDKFGRTWVLANGKPETNGVVAVGLYGDRVRIGHGSKGGWDTFGPERVVTRSVGNVLYTLDDKPALGLYKEYLGERAAGLPGSALLFPLALRGSTSDANSVVRTVLSVDEETQSMTFAGDIPTGAYAKLMRANFDRLILGAQAAGEAAMKNSEGPSLSIAISCVGRRLVLGERTEEETEATLETLPQGTKQIGFYSYGEISPHTTGRCDLHNQTMTLTVLSEAP